MAHDTCTMRSARQFFTDLERSGDWIIGRDFGKTEPCWAFVRFAYAHGLGVHLHTDPSRNGHLVPEVWWRDESPEEAIGFSRPWDVWACGTQKPWTTHVGIVIDHSTLIHANKEGVWQTPLRRWSRYLLGIYRPLGLHTPDA